MFYSYILLNIKYNFIDRIIIIKIITHEGQEL